MLDEFDLREDANVIEYGELVRTDDKDHPCATGDVWSPEQVAFEILERLPLELELEEMPLTHLARAVYVDDLASESDWGLGNHVRDNQFVVVGNGPNEPRYLVTVTPYTPEMAKADVEASRGRVT